MHEPARRATFALRTYGIYLKGSKLRKCIILPLWALCVAKSRLIGANKSTSSTGGSSSSSSGGPILPAPPTSGM